MRFAAAICAFTVALTFLSLAHAEDSPSGADAILGKWVTDEGKAHVEIWKPEKPATVTDKSKKDELKGLYGTYCGRITWLKEPEFPEGDVDAGKTKVDKKNPDASKRDKPVIGLLMLKGFSQTAKGKWTGGTIYDPENGKTYKCQITMAADKPKVLNLRGYIGIPALGRTTIWNRYQPPKEKEVAGEKAPAPAE
jgi:uncharacterized protein (DUF2147 family)